MNLGLPVYILQMMFIFLNVIFFMMANKSSVIHSF